MGKPVFLDPVDYISGKISRKFRTVYNRRQASDRRYTQVRNPRSSQPNADELANRHKFRNVRLAAMARSKNLSNMTRDQQAFLEEKKAQGARFKYTTYIGWLFSKGWQYYDDETEQVVWPQSL